ncbi:MAG: 3-hydroxyacyl-CoA dehydrogenase family protein [Geminicoccaceae bacterium]
MSGFAGIAVVGAGTMGHALALVHALAGCRVRLHDKDPATLERARGLMRNAADTLVQAGEITEAVAEEALSRVELTEDLRATIGEADLVIEAIIENVEAKQALFASIDEMARKDAVIASNTSYLDPFPLIPQARQKRSVVTHWYTPPYIIDLVDIAAGPATDPSLPLALRDFYAGMGKRPVLFDRLIQGYVANRLQSALTLEIVRLLDEGLATPQLIDDSIRHGLAHRLALQGQLAKVDHAGLDMMRRALANRVYHPPEVKGHCRVLDELMAEGRRGISSGGGFYDYDEDAETLLRRRDLKLLALRRAIGDIEREYGP